jgi:hypothetical protein
MKSNDVDASEDQRHTDTIAKRICGLLKRHRAVVLSLCVLTAFSIYLLTSHVPLDSSRYPVVWISNGARIQLKNEANGLFVRIPSTTEVEQRRLTEEDTKGERLILDQSRGWLDGGSFTIEESGECFLLKANNGKYLTVDHKTGELHAAGSRRIFADAFAAVSQTPILMESRPNSPYSNYRRVLHMQSPGGEGGKGASRSTWNGSRHRSGCSWLW